jgi:hypothetical protein
MSLGRGSVRNAGARVGKIRELGECERELEAGKESLVGRGGFRGCMNCMNRNRKDQEGFVKGCKGSQAA